MAEPDRRTPRLWASSIASGGGPGVPPQRRTGGTRLRRGARIFAAVVRPERRQTAGDVEAERARLAKEIARAEGMLANERFVANAPADVVDGERAKLERYRRELDLLGV